MKLSGIKIYFFLQAVLVALAVNANAGQPEDWWIQDLSMEIRGSECQCLYEPMPGAVIENRILEMRIMRGKSCGDVDVIVSSGTGGIFSFEMLYKGSEPLAAERSVVLGLRRPVAAAVTGSYVDEQNWTTPFWRRSLRGIPDETQYLLWRYPEGDYGVMIPLVGGGMTGTLSGRDRGIAVVSQSSIPEFNPPLKVPLCTIGRGSDPYTLTHNVYKHSMRTMEAWGKLRDEKEFPEIFKYLGWCSWNAHYRNVTLDNILEHAISFEISNAPVKWILVGDGWQDVDVPRYRSPSGSHLISFKADAKKFPGDLAGLVKKLEAHGIKWVGASHQIQGNWNGVALDSDIGAKYKDSLLAYNDIVAIPDPRENKGRKFYRDFYRHLSEQGIDFVKVDNQSLMHAFITDKMPVATAMLGQQKNMQIAAEEYFGDNVINCMEMEIAAVYCFRLTNLGRTSRDYVPADPYKAKNHVLENVMNSLWFGELCWPDYDMFMTSDEHALMHALARAVSGGPVYFTDKAGLEKFEVLKPLVFSDGKVIRPDKPALPAEDCLFSNPESSPCPLKAFTLSGRAGILAAWNVFRSTRYVAGKYGPGDIKGMDGETFAVYDFFTQSMELMKKSDRRDMVLPPWGVSLKIFAPIESGTAVFGLLEKYISPGAVRLTSIDENKLMVELEEGGMFGAYMEKMPEEITVEGEKLDSTRINWKDNLLKLDLGEYKGRKISLEIAK